MSQLADNGRNHDGDQVDSQGPFVSGQSKNTVGNHPFDYKVDSESETVVKKSEPNFNQQFKYEVAVPFAVSPEKIQQSLLKFLKDLISTDDMRQVQKLFFVPVGLPGMGKSTLAKNIRLSIENNLTAESKARHQAAAAAAKASLKLQSASNQQISSTSQSKQEKTSSL